MMRNIGFNNPSVTEKGLLANMKEFACRASNRFLDYKPRENFRTDYATSLAIDVSKPNCIEKLVSPGMPAFLR